MAGDREIPLGTIGILLAYSPAAEIQREGLGRYLVAFVKSATRNRRVVLAMPSWSRKPMRELFKQAGIPLDRIEMVGPTSQPLLLRLYFLIGEVVGWFRLRQRRKRKGPRLSERVRHHVRSVLGRLFSSRNILVVLLLALYLAVLAAIGIVVAIPVGVVLLIAMLWKRGAGRIQPRLDRISKRIVAYRRFFTRRLYEDIRRNEMSLIADAANGVAGVPAWYVPTPFWSTAGRLARPQLICVPDVVFSEFPAAFASQGAHVLESYKAIERVLAEGRDFVTYSERIKHRVLVDRFAIRPEQVSVVRHAPMDLERHVNVTGYTNVAVARRLRSQSLLGLALSKSVIQMPVANADFDFIFYPTQFRPSKNVISLLRAYDHLVKTKFFGHKLVLTGNPKGNDDIMSFVTSHDLELDVLFLKDLDEAELAGCYHLASLAVNCSITEGGMPFTFTEALSVNTPVIMGDIEVTREIITDRALADATLFDPYDWRAVAAKIEWGIEHRAELLAMQSKFYKDVLVKRSWDDVVDEHLVLLDTIGSRAAPA